MAMELIKIDPEDDAEYAEIIGVTLPSTPAVNTPGLFDWLKAGFNSDRTFVVRTLAQTYHLKEYVAYGLLSGEIPYTVDLEKETVKFLAVKGEYKAE